MRRGGGAKEAIGKASRLGRPRVLRDPVLVHVTLEADQAAWLDMQDASRAKAVRLVIRDAMEKQEGEA